MLSGSETAITSIPKQKVHQLDETRKNNRIKRAKENIEKTIFLILKNKKIQNKISKKISYDFKKEIKYIDVESIKRFKYLLKSLK